MAADLDGQASLSIQATVTDMRAEKRTDWSLSCESSGEAVNPDGAAIYFHDFVTEGPTQTVLTIEGELWINNGGSGDAPVESVIINLQTKDTGPFFTVSSVACGDPTQLCNASGPDKLYLDNEGSGDLVLLDAAGVDICDALPTIGVGEEIHLTYIATFFLDPLGLEEGDHARTEALVTFSNAGERGGSGASCPNPQEEGDYIRTVASRISGQIPPIVEINQSVEFCKWISVAPDSTIVTVPDFVIDSDGRQTDCPGALPGIVPLDGTMFCCTVLASGVEGTQTLFTVTSTATCESDGQTSIENTATLTGSDSQDGITGSPAVCSMDIVCDSGGGGGGIEEGDFCTQTQGGWGTRCNGNNPGCMRDDNFEAVFPNDLVVGGTHTITLTSSAAVEAFLPQGGTPSPLTGSHVDPLATEAGVLAGQVVALTLNVEFDLAGVGLNGPSGLGCGGGVNLNELVLLAGPCAGKTVQEVLDEANSILGGDGGSLSASQISDCAAMINENFVDCDTDNGHLACP